MTAKRYPFTYPGTITLDTLPDLLSFHRATFGGYRMEDAPAGGEPAGGDKGGAAKGDGDKGKEFQPITSQEDLDRVLGARLARERERYSDYDDLKAAKAEYDKHLEAAMSDQEKAVNAARKEGETTATERANARLVSAEARALAAHAKFRDPADAVAFLDLKDVKVGEDGTVDAKALGDKLKALSESKPYLVDDGASAGKPAPRADKSQGSGGTSAKPGDAGRLAAQQMGFIKQPAAS